VALDMNAERYRPCNGTEGEIFDAEWCAECERDRAYRDDPDADPALGCQILARALAFDIDDPQYPVEWVRIQEIAEDGYLLNRGECTAFIPRGEPIPPPKDELTIEMFPETLDMNAVGF
jgi:hypothetical protein